MNVYLDNNATTIVDPHVFEAMEPYFVQKYGNPNSLHAFASDTHPGIKSAMERIYAGINANKEDSVVITSCATESNNWVLKSIYFEQILTGKKDSYQTELDQINSEKSMVSENIKELVGTVVQNALLKLFVVISPYIEMSNVEEGPNFDVYK